MRPSLHVVPLAVAALLSAACGEKPKPEPVPAPRAAVTSPAAPEETAGEAVAAIETSEGNIVLRFFAADAPKTVAEFKRLAGRSFYQGTTFHRVIPDRLIQGGDPLSRDRDPYNDGTGNSGIFLPPEFNRRPFKRGTVGLARGPDPNSGSCQFFISLSRNPAWDGNYTAFAEVIEGIEVADAISRAQTNPKALPQLRERPIREQLIKTIRLERRKVG